MVTYDEIVKDITEVTDILGDYAVLLSDLKKSWKGKSYDNLALKGENFRSANITKVNESLRALVNATTNYNSYYLKYKNNYLAAKRNYDMQTDDSSTKGVFKDQMTYFDSEMKKSETYIKDQLSSLNGITVEGVSSRSY